MAAVTIVVTQNADNSVNLTSTSAPGWTLFVPAANASQTGPQVKRIQHAIKDILQANLSLSE